MKYIAIQFNEWMKNYLFRGRNYFLMKFQLEVVT